MQLDAIGNDLKDLSFQFFYWFSRFEFALKENKYLRDKHIGATAEPNWTEFVKRWQGEYVPSAAASRLITANPKRQVVGAEGLKFQPVGLADKPSDLEKVVRLAKTVRNNLFHGGKHGEQSWDDPDRMRLLLTSVIDVLGELADLAGIEADFRRMY